MKKVLVVFGTRPEAIKMAPVVSALQMNSDRFSVRVCLTGQHREMLDQVMGLFQIESHYDLKVMTPGQNLYSVTSKVLLGLKDVLEKEAPDVVLVHGDTTTSTVAALAAFYNRIAVGHVEAGLRSNYRYSPFPEEMNRRLTACLSNLHFAPTSSCRNNLLLEGIPESRIFVTGNTAIDALLWGAKNFVHQEDDPAFSPNKRGILVTAHRRENFGKGIENICLAIKELVSVFSDIEVIYPVHRNPNILEPVNRILSSVPNVRLIDPLDYRQFSRLMSEAYLILTDSGGVQEEAPSLGKPVLVLRDCTERPEAVTAGTVKLVGADLNGILSEVKKILDSKSQYDAMAKSINPYGDGKASGRIVGNLFNCLKNNDVEPLEVTSFQ